MKNSKFVLMDKPGVSMLELTEDDSRALQVVVLITNTKSQTYGAAHHANLKKVCVPYDLTSLVYLRITASDVMPKRYYIKNQCF